MPVRSRAMVPSTASRVMIRVENFARNRMAGLIYNPYLDKIERFGDVLELTNKLDGIFDTLSFPQATMAYRSFHKKGKGPKPREDKGEARATADDADPAQREREVNTIRQMDKDVFIVHVQFRQNASWQGTIKWAGQNEEVRFRSTLEMLKIMDSALQQSHPENAEDRPFSF
ncbi:MAG: hypothetical protein AB7V55_02070 [Oscillospiraceae bacterium]